MRYAPLLRGVHLAGLTVLLLTAGPAALTFAQEGSGTRGGYWPPPPAQPQAAPVTLEVRLPADALLEIEGVRTRSTGEIRRFVSPPLAVGKKYHYTLKATWREGPKQVVRERVVPVVAGQEVVVDFRREEPPRKNEQPPKRGKEPQKEVNEVLHHERRQMVTQTLLRQGSPLAEPRNQLQVLAPQGRHKPFDKALAESGLFPLRATGIQVLQINVGKLCNQTCRHCHVDAGPDRREVMNRETMQDCLDVLARIDIPALDITGGAPEMNPHFRWLVTEARRLGRHVIDRCNLTILLAPGYQDLPDFLAGQRVEVVASLPCYLAENTDAQRGTGVFDKSIAALRRLNALGYGQPDSGLILTLVYNPVGPSLPPPQASLEEAYRRELKARYGVVFNRLYTITNMPISRFLDDLLRSGRYDQYMQKLIDAYNPAAAAGVMCRTTLSVGWNGRLYDCDFNQMLDLRLAPGLPQHIRDFDFTQLKHRPIVVGQHCYGCTAGCGSGCQGAVLALVRK